MTDDKITINYSEFGEPARKVWFRKSEIRAISEPVRNGPWCTSGYFQVWLGHNAPHSIRVSFAATPEELRESHGDDYERALCGAWNRAVDRVWRPVWEAWE